MKSVDYVTFAFHSVVGIATYYGLDGQEIESQWVWDFPFLSRPALGPTQPPIQWIPCFSRVQSGQGLFWHPPRSSAEDKESVEQYIHSPPGLRGLFYDELHLLPLQLWLFTTLRKFLLESTHPSHDVSVHLKKKSFWIRKNHVIPQHWESQGIVHCTRSQKPFI